jgi:monoterpene epsilon-lactone hydrolase
VVERERSFAGPRNRRARGGGKKKSECAIKQARTTTGFPARMKARVYAPPALKCGALLAVMLAFYSNHRAEINAPDRMGWVRATLHTVVYIIRKVPQLFLVRVLGFGQGVPGWSAFEELAMRVLQFHAHVGDVSVPNRIIDVYSRANELVSRIVHGVHVTDVGPQLLGFGPGSSGRTKFGPTVNCSAKWIAVNEGTKFLGHGVKVFLFYHGGGYCIGNSTMYLSGFGQLLRNLADQGVVAGILSIDYPLAPEFQHPIPIDSGHHVYEFLVNEKGLLKPEDVIVSGDSAGGNLAVNIALRATHLGLAGAVLFSPWVGFSNDTPSQLDLAKVDFIGGPELQAQYQAGFMPGGRDACMASSMLHLVDRHGPFASLPPVWLSLGEHEVFKDDIGRFANALEAHDVAVTLFYGEKAPHIFPMLWPLFRQASEPALKSVAEFCSERFSRASADAAGRRLAANAFDKFAKQDQVQIIF